MNWGNLRFSLWKKLGVASRSLNSMSWFSMLVTYYHVCKLLIQSLSLVCSYDIHIILKMVYLIITYVASISSDIFSLFTFLAKSTLFIFFFPSLGISYVQQDPFISKPRKLLPRKFLKILLRCVVGFSILYVVSSWEVTLRRLVEINYLTLVLSMKGKHVDTIIRFLHSSWDLHGVLACA